MQFLTKGPDIPDQLLQAHEDGRVVFFCGAGISYPAGLPGFKGLVDEIYRQVGTTLNAIEQEAYGRGQYDATLDLLERRLPGQRAVVRGALVKALRPNLRRKGATDTHQALLKLARCRDGALRLVTTNFDRVFERVIKRNKLSIFRHTAPMLPIPKNSRWNGLVYLHGLLPDQADVSALNRLVVTSGDFGLAYLTERWAARFVGELFRNYVVCFVGYSINDPVLRYMMDALAADRMLGGVTPEAYAFGDCSPGSEHGKTLEWQAKGVRPILYEVPTGTQDHSLLYRTLQAWADIYRDGILGKERMVVEYAIARPSASTQQDDFVSRLLWALSDTSGLPAKRFADNDPVPSLEWLDAFTIARYQHGDLARFNVPPHAKVDEKLRFSLVKRPIPYTLAPWMRLVSGGAIDGQWDEVMTQLARWLVRHLDDPKLTLWLARWGGQLHERLAGLIENQLDMIYSLEGEGNSEELERIRSKTPSAIPRPIMRTLWRLFLTGRVKSPGHQLGIYHWKRQLEREGLTATLRFHLRELLAPRVVLKEPFRWPTNVPKTDAFVHLKELVDWELVLTADHVGSALGELAEGENWRRALPALFDDLEQLLGDALELQCELGSASYRSDRSHWDLPSIIPHWQNRGYSEWVVLIELVRDAWRAIHEIDAARSLQIAKAWFAKPYPTFKRLALYAASQHNAIPPDEWVDWLISDDARWLWAVDSKREALRLIVLRGGQLTSPAQQRLEEAILAGPPRTMYKEDLELELWKGVVDRSVWLHLAKLQSSGAPLHPVAAKKLAALRIAHPNWELAPNERDEFSRWMSGTGDPDFEDIREIDSAPRRRTQLAEWLRQPRSSKRPFHEDTWLETCRSRFFHCALALCDLAREGNWPADRWSEAFQAWREDGRVSRSWRFIAPLVQTMPDELLKEIGHSITWWLEAAAKTLDRHEDIFLDLCRRILGLPHDDGVYPDEPVTSAINHPVGRVTQALLNLWFQRKPNDTDGLPADLEPYFTQMCDTSVPQFRHGRVLLAAHLIALFRVDSTWSKANLLPLLDWKIDSTEARAAWAGFLWSPRMYRPLLSAFKTQFLETARHYTDLGDHAQQFAAFLTHTALDPVESYNAGDFQTAFGALPHHGLEDSARALAQALEGAGEQREDYWANRIQPLWQNVWPKSRHLASKSIAESLARLSIAARGKFPAALTAILDWLQPIEQPHFVVHLLYESGLSDHFPEDALGLLDAIVDDQPWPPRELQKCLDAIRQAAPALVQDSRYQRLTQYFRRRLT